MKKYSIVATVIGLCLSLSSAFAQVADEVSNSIDCANITHALKLGSKDSNTGGDVSALQIYLAQANYLDGDPTGYFGRLTFKAVQAFQKEHGIVTQGNVGPYTRAKIKEASCGNGSVATPTPVTPTPPLPPVYACTMEYHSCPDGSPMPRDPNCTWRADKCAVSPVYRILATVTMVAYESGSLVFYGANFKTGSNAGYYATYKNDCGSVSSGCGGTLSTINSNSSNKVSFVFPLNTQLENYGGNVTVQLYEGGGTLVSGTYTVTVSLAGGTPTITGFLSSEPSTVTGSVYLVGTKYLAWSTSKAANVSLDVICTPGIISFTTNRGNSPTCEKGGIWTWQNQNVGGITVTPVGNTSPVTVQFVLTILDSNGAYTNQKQSINVTFPAVQATNVSTTNSVEILSAPVLSLQYDYTGKESVLTGKTTVKITAGSGGMNYYLNNGVPSIINFYNTQSGSAVLSRSLKMINYAGTSNENGVHNLQAGKSETYVIALTAPTKELFAGSYSLKFNDFYGSDGVVLVPNTSFTGKAWSNSVTIIGETSPFISEVKMVGDSKYGDDYLINGSRFIAAQNQVTIGSVTKSFPSEISWISTNSSQTNQGNLIRFKLSDFGITQSGYYYVTVATNNGSSNTMGFTVTNVQTTASTDPLVEIIGSPTLSLQYDAVGKEPLLVGKAKVKITAGNSAITFYQTSVPYIFQFSNNLSAVYSNGMLYSAIDSTGGSATVIPANTSITYAITNIAKTSELFAGSYALRAGTLGYTDSNGNYQSVTSYRGIQGTIESNPVTIIGEISPYITDRITCDATPRVNCTIIGTRFDSSSNIVSINGVSKTLQAFPYPPSEKSAINFQAADFGITSAGAYVVQVTTKSGASNHVSFAINNAPTAVTLLKNTLAVVTGSQ